MWVKCRAGEGSGRENKGVTGMRWERQAPPGNSGWISWAREVIGGFL